MNSNSVGVPGLTPPGRQVSNANGATSAAAQQNFAMSQYSGYPYSMNAYNYPSYSTVPGVQSYPGAYNSYYAQFAQYGPYYGYGYPQYNNQQTTVASTEAKSLSSISAAPPALPVGYSGLSSSSSKPSSVNSTSTYCGYNYPSLYASSYGSGNAATNTTTTTTTTATTTPGGAYSNPFTAYYQPVVKAAAPVQKKKKISRFDLAGTSPKVPVSKPVSAIPPPQMPPPPPPPQGNLNMNIVNAAYRNKQKARVLPSVPQHISAPSQTGRKRSRSRSSSYSSDSDDSRSLSPKSVDVSVVVPVTDVAKRLTRAEKRRLKNKGGINSIDLTRWVEDDTNKSKRRIRFNEISPVSIEFDAASVDVNVQAGRVVVGTMMTMEKDYFRLTTIPTADTIRPKDVLHKWLDILNRRMIDKAITYEYYSNQLRAIRQDLTVQQIQDDFTVRVYEEHARFALLNDDMNEFNRCQTQLKDLYGQKIPSSHVTEFTCYQLLYCLFSQQHIDTNMFLMSLSKMSLKNPEIRLIIEVCTAIRREDYSSFFSYYDRPDLPFECKHFMTQFFRRIRLFALYSLFTSVKPSVSLYQLMKELHFDSYAEAITVLSEFGVVFPINPNRKDLTDELCQSVCLPVAECLLAIRNQQLAEKGTKLL